MLRITDLKLPLHHAEEELAAAIRQRLRETYGAVVIEPHGDPLGELILTVLSQSTNDRNRDVAFIRLRNRFASWEEVRAAPVDQI